MTILKKNRVLAAKIETTVGTAIALANADVIYGAYDVMIQPNIDFVKRDAQVSGSQAPGTLGAYGGTATFKTELRGDGAAGTPAWASVLLPACGYTVTTGTFSPVTAAPGSAVKTITIGSYQGGKKKFLRGAAGTFKVNMVAGQRIEIEWTFTGVWQAPADVAMLTNAATYGTALRFANSTFTIAAGAVTCVDTLSIDAGNGVSLLSCPTPSDGSGLHSAIVGTRGVMISMDPEAKLAATEDTHGLWLAGNEQAFSLAVTDGTDTITFAAPKIQRMNVQEADRSDVETDQIEFQANMSAAAGDDEFTIDFS